MRSKSHRATQPAAIARGGTSLLDPSKGAAAPQHDQLLQLQRDAGNGAVCQLLLQREATLTAPKPKAKKPKQPKSEFNDIADFLDGFQQLAIAATTGGARSAYGPKLGPDLSDEHRAVLERVRRVLIKSQGDKAARKAAQAEWPRLVAQLMAGVEAGRRLGMSARNLTLYTDNIDAVGEHYVKAKDNRSNADAGYSSADSFASGVDDLLGVIGQKWFDLSDGIIPRDVAAVDAQQQAALAKVQFGAGLSKRHLALLEKLRQALISARTQGSAKQAVVLWKEIATDVSTTLDPKLHANTRNRLADIGNKLIVGGLYAEKHNAALAKVDLKNPKEFIQLNQLKVIAKDLIVAKDVADKAVALGAGASMGAFFHAAGLNDELGGAIWDLAKNPGDIAAKVGEWKKMGLVERSVTVADLADKMLALRQAVYTVSLNAIKDIAERQGKAALATGAAELVAKWKGVGEWATKHLEAVKAVGKVAGIIGIAVSVIKIADAIAKGDYGAAFQEAVSTGLQLGAAAAGGVAGGAMFAGIGVIIAAEIEGISGAAAMIRYAKEANLKEAALDFIHVCEDAASIEAKDLLADMKLLGDPDLADQQAAIQQRLVGHLEWWNRHVGRMRALYLNDRVNALGGQNALRASLGSSAKEALFAATPATWEGLGGQIRDVFQGANNMSKYVAKQYGVKD